MERGFLSQKGSGGGRGVKEKDINRNKKNISSEKQNSLEDTTVLGSFPPLSTPGTTTVGNAPESIRAINERFPNTAYGFFLGKKVAYTVVANYFHGLDAMLKNGPCFIRNNPIILKKWHPDENLMKEDISIVPGRSSYARAMIELQADVKLKDNIVMDMPKITREGHYTCNVCVEYEWKPPMSLSCKVFGHIHEECPKNTGAGEKKTVKMPSQTSRGVPVGPKIGFKPHKEYRPVSKKSIASSSGNKKKGEEPTIDVSNSNPFDVLNLVDNDVEFGTNGGTTNLVNNEATSSGSSFMNVDNSSSGNTPIIEKIRNFEDLLTSGQAILEDKDGNTLKKVEFPGEDNSEDEVASVDNDMARSMAYDVLSYRVNYLIIKFYIYI
ncbi:RNA-directed DNA polymerase, eukaryota, reverse transcriptase zinc-binding domain protein [Tanacetum coccineum]